MVEEKGEFEIRDEVFQGSTAEEELQKDEQNSLPRIKARYIGNAPIKVKQGFRGVMLWPNQVYKRLELNEDVQFLLKKRKLQKIKTEG
jgi:hypothetical protein